MHDRPRKTHKLTNVAAFAALMTAALGNVGAGSALAQQTPTSSSAPPTDSSYSVTKTSLSKDGSDQILAARLVSQTFQGARWEHLLMLVRPPSLAADQHVLLLIKGGKGGEAAAPAEEVRGLKALAAASHLVVGELRQVPNQPIFDGKLEDEAISYTFGQFFQTGDHRWPLLVPMVTSARRAMDAVQTLAATEWGLKIKDFTLAGESKRGWTTWLTAAADSRVAALAPQVFDIVNILPQIAHQKEVWGELSEELGDYSKTGLPQLLATPRGGELLSMIDPYTMLAKLVQPKLVILATNDRYWPVDAAQLYYPELQGPKHLLYLPNQGHEISDTHLVMEERAALALAAAGKLVLPKIASSVHPATPGGPAILEFSSDLKPSSFALWQATSATRDFRLATWRSLAKAKPSRTASIALPLPSHGFTATMLQASYDLAGHPWTESTPVAVVGH